MPEKRTAQVSIYVLFTDLDLGRELRAMSAWLEAHREIFTPVMSDLCRHGLKPTGRRGLSAETVMTLSSGEYGGRECKTTRPLNEVRQSTSSSADAEATRAAIFSSI